jgi:hypothetical protein
VVWGVGGIVALLVYAAASLGAYAITAIEGGLTPWQWAALIVNALGMAWAEGYRGFQQKFSPRVVARAAYLHAEPSPLRLWLAPFFCAGYFDAVPRVRRTVWIGTALIVLAVLAFNAIAQPWRGILDAGVLVGLSWGTVSLLVQALAAVLGAPLRVSPEVPVGARL